MDTEKLLKLLKEHKVYFVIIGATAFPVHGYSRATLDIGIFIRPDESNAEKTWKALKKFGYDMTDISVDDLHTKKLLIRQYRVETDIHPFVKGVTFERIWKNKVRAKFGDTASKTTIPAAIVNTVIVAVNTDRKEIYITNNSNKTMWISYGAAATVDTGIPLVKGGILIEDVYRGAINAIWETGVSGDANVTDITT